MNFSSDNVTGVCPEIAAAVNGANKGPAMPYGADDATSNVETAIKKLFQCEADVFLLSTGTAANVLALSVLCPPYGSGNFWANASYIIAGKIHRCSSTTIVRGIS